MKKLKVIGKSIPRKDSIAKATGQAIYSADLVLPNTLCGKILRSPYAHAKIIKIDTSKAKELQGVRAILTAKDISNNTDYWHGGDGWVLADNEVKYIGDPVALIAADNEDIAEKAASLIEVEYEQIESVVYLSDATKDESPNSHADRDSNIVAPMKVTRGDIEGEFEKATVFVSDKFVFPALQQGYLEPTSATAKYEFGELTVYCASQVWFRLRKELSKITNLPESNIIVKPMEIGGAFGARNESTIPVCAALLAIASKKPVKITCSRLEELQASRPSVEMEIEMTIAADEDGNFLGKKIKALADFGVFDVHGSAVMWIACLRADTNYRFNSVDVEACGLYTNRPPTTAYRGFGSPQMHFALETMIDELAIKLNMDPIELRLKNFIKTNQKSIHGYKVSSCGLEECMEKARELMDWDNKKKNKKAGKGLGVAALVHAAGSRAGEPEFGGGSAILKIDGSGRYTIFVGEAELGQGSKMVMAQIVAEEFGIDPQDVNVVMGDTDKTPFSTGTHGSKVTTVLGNAVLFACKNVKEQITNAIREHLGTGEVSIKNNKVLFLNGETFMDLPQAIEKVSYFRSGQHFIGLGTYEPDAIMPDETGYGNIAPTYLFGVQMAEVTVDENNNITIDKIVSVHDVGRVINPKMALGQVYGGVMQGLGLTIMEDAFISDSGVYRNNTLLEYKLPTIKDVPEISVGFVETNDPHGPYGAKGLGEPPIISVAPAITNAIHDAVGLRVTQLPVTPQRIQQIIKEKERSLKK